MAIEIIWDNIHNSWPVDQLIPDPDPKTYPEWSTDVLVAITGYLQKGPDATSDPDSPPEFIRIYTSLDLNEYVQISGSQIKMVAPSEYNPINWTPDNPKKQLTPITVWVSRFTKVDHAQRNEDETVQRHENFLAGEIVDTYLPGVITEGMPLQRGANPAQVVESLVARCSIGGCGFSDTSPCVR